MLIASHHGRETIAFCAKENIKSWSKKKKKKKRKRKKDRNNTVNIHNFPLVHFVHFSPLLERYSFVCVCSTRSLIRHYTANCGFDSLLPLMCVCVCVCVCVCLCVSVCVCVCVHACMYMHALGCVTIDLEEMKKSFTQSQLRVKPTLAAVAEVPVQLANNLLDLCVQ